MDTAIEKKRKRLGFVYYLNLFKGFSARAKKLNILFIGQDMFKSDDLSYAKSQI